MILRPIEIQSSEVVSDSQLVFALRSCFRSVMHARRVSLLSLRRLCATCLAAELTGAAVLAFSALSDAWEKEGHVKYGHGKQEPLKVERAQQLHHSV